MVEIQIKDTRGNIIKYQLGEGRHVLGKSRVCDILLMDRFVSRRHAELLVTDNLVYLLDNNSTNGTWIKNRKAVGVIELCFVEPVRMGALLLSVHPLLYTFALRPGRDCSLEDFCNTARDEKSQNVLHLHKLQKGRKKKSA